MKTIEPSALLRGALQADAWVSGAVALLQLAMANALASWLNLPATWLVATGAFLIGYVVLLVVLARSPRLSAGWVWLVILGNVVWAVGCVLLPASGAVKPSGLGYAFLAVHAVAVLLFAGLEAKGLAGSPSHGTTPVTA